MKKGFTLIELLAVIVILALVALIATPLVLDIINDTKEETDKRNVENIIKAAKVYESEQELKKEVVLNDVNILNNLNIEGKKPEEYSYDGYGVYLNEEGEVAIALKYGKKCYKKNYNESKIKSFDFDTYKCTVVELEKWDGTIDEVEPEGDIYYIYNAKQLAWVSQASENGASFEGKKIVIKNNIDMGSTFDSEGNLISGYKFTPIGHSNRFYGDVDGEDHFITNLYINETSNFAGLFGKYSGNSFKNLTLRNSYIKTAGNVAGIIGGNTSSSPTAKTLVVENIKSIDNVIIADNNYSGGIVGQMFGKLVQNCYSNSTVIGFSGVGGIVGIGGKRDAIYVDFINNVNEGNITGSQDNIGGITGQSISNKFEANINRGNITGVNGNGMGGITGRSISGDYLNNVNEGNITGIDNIGGITGYSDIGDYSNNINKGNIICSGRFLDGIIGHYISGTYSNNVNEGSVQRRNE